MTPAYSVFMSHRTALGQDGLGAETEAEKPCPYILVVSTTKRFAVCDKSSNSQKKGK
jgi:hypothetical protein